ncbi:MAG: oligoendopeptidase F [Eubacteriales bacterium]|nr:oligoendopeptidase F [Eubacteriales bacterium]MDD4389637.1 oligoendopeptidase F [Eubacteriales bacterium]
MCQENNNKKLKKRNEIPNEYKWDIDKMFASKDDWEDDFKAVTKAAQEYATFEGRLGESSDTLLNALKQRDNIWQKLEKVYVYSRMKKDEDNRISEYQAMNDRCNGLIAKTAASMSFFAPELLQIPEDTLMSLIDGNEGLEVYRFALLDSLRQKEHVLTQPEENILAVMSEVTSSTNDIFSMLNNADMKFGEIIDEDGDKVELTQGNYITFMESHDRNVRKQAFEHKYKAYIDLINTIATNYNYNTKTDVVNSRIRKYPSALEAALFGDNIEKKVYTNLIDTVRDALPSLHKYMSLRKKILGLNELHMYDVYVPLVELENNHIDYAQAIEMIKEGLNPLGNEYITRMTEGFAQGWVDVYENEGKTSGAYSFGSYDSYPYILMNYNNRLKDAFTLAHELGHSMHSSYTRESQPFAYGDHSIFTAEVASTVNESLLMKHLIKNAKDKNTKKYLINLHLEAFRTTLFRQTMFAEFELMTHEAAETGEVLTAEWLCEKYGELNSRYFGPDVINDEEIKYEWARIPHFYRAFYVYKYATGYSAAEAISDLIINGENEGGQNNARDLYKKFLASGSSDYPINLLKLAGVDMASKEPIAQAMKSFSNLVDELEKLI